jgi:hypothetical protein
MPAMHLSKSDDGNQSNLHRPETFVLSHPGLYLKHITDRVTQSAMHVPQRRTTVRVAFGYTCLGQ